ncbi:MAG TPA: energy transducer TonB [Opitutaceae bacterium]|nr:energy transducer TonB [Opitutaceae bacterium]
MNHPSVSVHYPSARTPARRDLAAGAAVALGLLAGSLWYGQAARRAFIPPAPSVHREAPVPLVPPAIDLASADDAAPASAPASGPQVQDIPDLPQPVFAHAPFQPVEPARLHPTIDDRAAVVPPGGGDLAGGERVFNPDSLDQVPVATFQPAPNYPYALKREGISGTATVDFIVEADGTTSHVSVAGARSEFGDSAAQALARWRFRPGRKLGRAVRTHMVVPVRFTLESAP